MNRYLQNICFHFTHARFQSVSYTYPPNTKHLSAMAPSVLGVGIPATSSLTPRLFRSALQRALDAMEADMKASPYDWEMFYLEPDTDFSLLVAKLREKSWDVVMVGSKISLPLSANVRPKR